MVQNAYNTVNLRSHCVIFGICSLQVRTESREDGKPGWAVQILSLEDSLITGHMLFVAEVSNIKGNTIQRCRMTTCPELWINLG